VQSALSLSLSFSPLPPHHPLPLYVIAITHTECESRCNGVHGGKQDRFSHAWIDSSSLWLSSADLSFISLSALKRQLSIFANVGCRWIFSLSPFQRRDRRRKRGESRTIARQRSRRPLRFQLPAYKLISCFRFQASIIPQNSCRQCRLAGNWLKVLANDEDDFIGENLSVKSWTWRDKQEINLHDVDAKRHNIMIRGYPSFVVNGKQDSRRTWSRSKSVSSFADRRVFRWTEEWDLRK